MVREISVWKKIGLVIAGGLTLSGCSLLPFGGAGQGAIRVESNETFNVYLDETFLGQTPVEDEKIKAGDYNLRLVAGDGTGGGEWQTKVRIAKQTMSVVRYETEGGEEEATSLVLELEKLTDKKAVELSVSSIPDHVVVKLDGELQGFSPLLLDEVGAGDHEVRMEAPGYKPKTIGVKTNEGQRLKVIASLARDPAVALAPAPEVKNASSSGEINNEKDEIDNAGAVEAGVVIGVEKEESINEPYVEVLDTGFEWLRVRSQPSGLGENEVAKVKVGTFFRFVERSDNNEWVRIEYQSGKEGWVSNSYVRVVE